MEWNYYDTLITVADDCPTERGVIPPMKKSGLTKAGIEYDLVAKQPYSYTQEELLFETYVRHKQISAKEIEERGDQIRAEFFSKPMPCMRASMLPKKYGWGIHFNKEGKLALIPMESPDYKRFQEDDGEIRLVPSMRNSRKQHGSYNI